MTQSSDGGPRRGWPRGRKQWLIGTIVLLAAGALVGLVLGSLLLGLMIAAVVSIGWLMAYESWRGRAPDLYDDDDDGARL
ncbi:hypothetical protein ABZ477_06425 [Microbacterium sp. NPDC019599]|uniref:hypothetical protein n=1 Tax=Microbacterium sp. NPDC019599 TaxID=3154690 RepID=UPI00340F5BE9